MAGAGGAPAGLLSTLQGANWGGGLDAFGKASKVAQASGLLNQQPQGQAMARLPRGQEMQSQSQSPGLLSFQQMYGQPVMDPETLRRLKRQQMGGMYG